MCHSSDRGHARQPMFRSVGVYVYWAIGPHESRGLARAPLSDSPKPSRQSKTNSIRSRSVVAAQSKIRPTRQLDITCRKPTPGGQRNARSRPCRSFALSVKPSHVEAGAGVPRDCFPYRLHERPRSGGQRRPTPVILADAISRTLPSSTYRANFSSRG